MKTEEKIQGPYALPDGWKWVRLGDYIKVSKEKTEDFSDPALKYVGLENMEKDKGITGYSDAGNIKSTKNKFCKGQILYGKLRPYLNKHDIADFDGICSTDILVFDVDENLNRSFFNYFLSTDYFIRYAVANSNGINLPRINEKKILNVPFPLPPLAEQRRIVERIESLLEKLDTAGEKIQQVLDTAPARKAAILHKAFTGELTGEDGGAESSDGMASKIESTGAGSPAGMPHHRCTADAAQRSPAPSGRMKVTDDCVGEAQRASRLERRGWKWVKLGECIHLLSGQDFPRAKYNDKEQGIPYITGASNFSPDGHVIINRWTETPTVIAKKNDILLVCKGSGYGKSIIADFQEAHIARQIMALRPNDAVLNEFLLYFLQNEIHYLHEHGQGLIPGISRSVVLNMELPLPPLAEQREIVRRVDDVFAKEQKVQNAAQTALEQVGLMKRAVLARAFRGEL